MLFFVDGIVIDRGGEKMLLSDTPLAPGHCGETFESGVIRVASLLKRFAVALLFPKDQGA
jgi:hypothetical protein